MVFGVLVEGVGDVPLEFLGGSVETYALVGEDVVVLLAIEHSELGVALSNFVCWFLKKTLVNSICLIPLFSFGLFG